MSENMVYCRKAEEMEVIYPAKPCPYPGAIIRSPSVPYLALFESC